MKVGNLFAFDVSSAGKSGASSQRRALTLLGSILSAAMFATSALAACPIELATYRDRDDTASLEFRPADAAAVTNSFRLILGETVLDGIVMWSEGVARPNGMLTYKCPEGDVTGPEYQACTVWQGVVYAADGAGTIGLLPPQGDPAPRTLLFADLAYAVHAFPAFAAGAVELSWDVFMLSGCQE